MLKTSFQQLFKGFLILSSRNMNVLNITKQEVRLRDDMNIRVSVL